MPPLFDDLRQLLRDGRELAESELAYQGLRLKLAFRAARTIALLGVAALLLAFFALVALTTGLLLGLAPLIGIWGATALVAGGFAAVALGFAAWMRHVWRRTKALLAPRNGVDGP